MKQRKKRFLFTTDKIWDGEEGTIAWYCRWKDGKIYPFTFAPITFSFELSAPITIYQVEEHPPFLFLLVKRTDFEVGWLHIFMNFNYLYTFSGVRKFAVYQSFPFVRESIVITASDQVLVILKDDFSLYSIPFNRMRIGNFTLDEYLPYRNIEVYDIMFYKDRLFLVGKENNRWVIYFSQKYLPERPLYFFYPANISPPQPFFTFPENFFIFSIPPDFKPHCYNGRIYTSAGIWEIQERQLGNYTLFSAKAVFEDRISTVQETKYETLIWTGTRLLFVNNKKIDERFFTETLFSNASSFYYKDFNFATGVLNNEEIFHFDPSEKLIITENYIIREYSSGDNIGYKVYRRSLESGVRRFDGKIYYISSFNNPLNYKYIKKIKIERSSWTKRPMENVQLGIESVPPLEFVVDEEITREEQNQIYENWVQVRSVGQKFLIEVQTDDFALQPFFEIEVDEGR